MKATLQAAVRLGNDYVDNLLSTKNQSKRKLKQLFNVTRKSIKDQKAIQGISVINWHQPTWQRTALLTDKAVQISKGKNLRVLRLSIVYGKDQWKSRQSLEGEDRLVSEYTSTKRIGSNRWGADGVRVEKFPRIHQIANPRRDSKHDDRNKV